MSDPDGNGQYQTFSGAGFGTLLVQLAAGSRDTPEVASSRAYLRANLPALYQDGDFGMRFIGALERVWDPVVAVLDALPAHFDPDFAPRDILQLLSAWLGVDLDESLPLRDRRETVRGAAELSRRRGTRRGLELALALSFPGVPLRVEDPGGVRWEAEALEAPVPPQAFVVYCDTPVPEHTQVGIARCIEANKPVHTPFRLRVRAARPTQEGPAV